jgi:hypothetical protein
MVALTKERNTEKKDGVLFSDPVAANTKIYAGSLVALNAAGFAVPATVSTTLKARGRAQHTVDNTGGLAGAVSIQTTKGVFNFANSGGGDVIARADIGNNAYMVDDQTVAKTDGTNTRSVAGIIVDIDAQGVWVRIV